MSYIITLNSDNVITSFNATPVDTVADPTNNQYDITDLNVDTTLIVGSTFDPVTRTITYRAPTPVDPDFVTFAEKNLPKMIQSILDGTAQEYGYDSILSAISYLDSPSQNFAIEARSFLTWRDTVWNWYFNLVAQVKAGIVTSIDSYDLRNRLPKFHLLT